MIYEQSVEMDLLDQSLTGLSYNPVFRDDTPILNISQDTVPVEPVTSTVTQDKPVNSSGQLPCKCSIWWLLILVGGYIFYKNGRTRKRKS